MNVVGKLRIADASTATLVPLYDSAQQAVTLGSTQHLEITDVQIVTDTELTVDLIWDNDGDAAIDAGERIAGGDFQARGGIVANYLRPQTGAAGKSPKIKASAAGNITVIFCGTIRNA